MAYSLNPKPRRPIAYGPDGERIFMLKQLPDIEFPNMLRITESFLEIDGYHFPYDCFQTKSVIWIQKMWVKWAYHPDMQEEKMWAADVLGELEERIRYWRAEFQMALE